MRERPSSPCRACEFEVSEALKRTLYTEYTRRLRLVLLAADLSVAKGQEWDRIKGLVQDQSQDPPEHNPFWRLLDSGIITLLSDIMDDSQINPVFHDSEEAALEDKFVRYLKTGLT